MSDDRVELMRARKEINYRDKIEMARERKKISSSKGGGEVLAGSDKSEKRGRKPGVPNKISRARKEMLLLAAENIGFPHEEYTDELDKDGNPTGHRVLLARTKTGKDGLLGYLEHLGLTDQKTFAGLLGRIIPQQINVKSDNENNQNKHKRFKHSDELRDELIARGVPESMLPPRLLPPPLLPRLDEDKTVDLQPQDVQD
jgi:hypothetical protein